MNNKVGDKTFEERLYEYLGVRYFKKVIVSIGRWIAKKRNNSVGNNYFLQELSIKGLKKFKKDGIKTNSILHIVQLPIDIFYIIITINTSTSSVIPLILIALLNSYCIMLQRYNSIRLNRILERINKKDNSNTENIMEIDNQEVSMKKENTTYYAEEKSLSLEDQKTELENLKNFVIAMTSSHSEEQIISEEKSYVKNLRTTRTKF